MTFTVIRKKTLHIFIYGVTLRDFFHLALKSISVKVKKVLTLCQINEMLHINILIFTK